MYVCYVGSVGMHMYAYLCDCTHLCMLRNQYQVSSLVSETESLCSLSSPVWLDRLDSKPLKSSHLHLPTSSLNLNCLWP